jgi:hypothetical protein
MTMRGAKLNEKPRETLRFRASLANLIFSPV